MSLRDLICFHVREAINAHVDGKKSAMKAWSDAADEIIGLIEQHQGIESGVSIVEECPHDLLTSFGRPIDGCEMCHGTGTIERSLTIEEVDALVADKVMNGSVLHYSTDISAAWLVIEKMKDSDYKHSFAAELWNQGHITKMDAKGASLAICRAALLVTMKEEIR